MSPLNNPRPVFSLYPRRIAWQLFAVIVLLCLIHVLVMGIFYAGLFDFKQDYGLLYWQITIFDLDEEESFGTWFNAIILLFAALLLYIHARGRQLVADGWYGWWLLLAIGFLLLSIDEIVGLHEYLNSALKEVSWTSVAAPAVAVVALLFIPFLLHLPGRTRILFAAAAVLYLGGALGVERWADRFADQDLLDTLEYNLWTAVEEVMEMSAVVLFIYALLAHMSGSPRRSLQLLAQVSVAQGGKEAAAVSRSESHADL